VNDVQIGTDRLGSIIVDRDRVIGDCIECYARWREQQDDAAFLLLRESLLCCNRSIRLSFYSK